MCSSSMPCPSVAKLALALALALVTAPLGWSDTVVGSIVLTGHDPDFHAALGGNTTGAINIIQDSMKFITDPAFNTFSAGGINQFLYVEGSTPPPGGNIEGDLGLAAAGFVEGVNYIEADASTLAAQLANLGTKYSALVVASDFGGNLTQAELSILDSQSTQIIAFLNKGGGLFAMAESGTTNPTSGQFGFLPFVVTSSQLNQSEVGNTLTPFGATLGLTNSDINGNASHNIFLSTGGLNVVDRDAFGNILTLAGRGQVTAGGVTPEPGTLILVGSGLIGVIARRRRKTT
jgi:hypothetical protein